MEIIDTAIPEVKIVLPQRFDDPRGFFCETWNRRTYAAIGLDEDFVQDNQAFSAAAGTLRGLHFQKPPHAQGKLVRAVRGAIFDVAVDIRPGSPTFGRHAAATLSAENGAQLWVPEGFAHGYLTLTPNTEVAYKTTSFYHPEAEGGLAWDDPALAIPWPVPVQHLAERDRHWPTLMELVQSGQL